MAAAAVDFANGNIFTICERDEKTRLLAAVLFPLLLDETDVNSSVNDPLTENSSEYSSSDDSNDSSAPEDLYDSAQIIAESVIFCYVFMRDPHLKVSKLYFEKYQISRKSVFRFLKNYCCNISKQSPTIHFAVLHSLAFVYHAIEFCTDKDYLEFQHFIPIWWEYIFNKTFKEEFYYEGDWEAFIEYVRKDFYTDITDPEFRMRWNLSSATLGWDFQLLELSDTDDFPISDESSSEEKESFCDPNETNHMRGKFFSYNAINKPQYSLLEVRGTCKPLLKSGSSQLLDNPYIVNKNPNEVSDSNLQFNPDSMNEKENFRIVSEKREAVCSPCIINDTREPLRNHALNESQLKTIPTSAIKMRQMLHCKRMMEHQQRLRNLDAINGTQQSAHNSSTMNEMQQTKSTPTSVIKRLAAFSYQSSMEEAQRTVRSLNEVNMAIQELQNHIPLDEEQETFCFPLTINETKEAIFVPIAIKGNVTEMSSSYSSQQNLSPRRK